ncbi:RibD family protein [Desulfurivibrio dismutans]|uniref:RibD family protein n=1 Tax=Desulfurivibrio dismutans TaxID=1398908 RepID=UPI0023D99B8A|nr:RibD family protein [Desulfurivibrio alkaliphilus]MDF1615010.1 RibD family protein [Desulfurivibrio alkaliphilus]
MQVSLIAVMTLCGRISPGTMGSRQDRRFLEETRLATDASLLGGGTLREGDAEMRGPDGVLPENRIRALISASGRLPMKQRKIFQTGPRPLIFTAAARAKSLAAEAGKRAEVLALPEHEGFLDLSAACRELSGRGVEKLLLEGGGTLNFHALRQGVVNELLVTIAPKLSGHRAAVSLVDGNRPLGDPFLDLQLLSCRPTVDGELFCRYRVNKN